jgi:hypothetical protein
VAEESGLFLRTVRDLRRIHSHLASFAYPILHSSQVRAEEAALHEGDPLPARLEAKPSLPSV